MEDLLVGMGHSWKISKVKNLCGNTDEPQSHHMSEHRKRELGKKESVVKMLQFQDSTVQRSLWLLGYWRSKEEGIRFPVPS